MAAPDYANTRIYPLASLGASTDAIFAAGGIMGGLPWRATCSIRFADRACSPGPSG